MAQNIKTSMPASQQCGGFEYLLRKEAAVSLRHTDAMFASDTGMPIEPRPHHYDTRILCLHTAIIWYIDNPYRCAFRCTPASK